MQPLSNFKGQKSSVIPGDSMRSVGSKDVKSLTDFPQDTKKSLGESIRSGFHSLRRKTSSWRRTKFETLEDGLFKGDSDNVTESDSEACQISLFDTQRQRNSGISTASSTRSHKLRFWLNSFDEVSDGYISAQSTKSTKSDAIIYQCPSKHRVRFWLNEKSPYGYSDSILEIRHSDITTRIIRSRCLANIVAVEASRMGEYRRRVRALKFASAATAAAYARFKKAERDINASHGSITNAAMYAYRAVAAASVIHPQKNGDFIRLQHKFSEHFKYQNEPGYFRRIKNIPMKDLKEGSAEYKMHQRLRAIPTPPMHYDILKFHKDRLDIIIAKGARTRSQFIGD